MGDAHELRASRHTVVLEVAEREVAQAGVLVVADVILDTGRGRVIALDVRDISWLV